MFGRSFAGEPFPLQCHAGFASIVVDCYGDVYPCHPWANWRQMPTAAKAGNLREVWASDGYGAIRKLTQDCRRCYLNCQAELSITLDIARGAVRTKPRSISHKRTGGQFEKEDPAA